MNSTFERHCGICDTNTTKKCSSVNDQNLTVYEYSTVVEEPVLTIISFLSYSVSLFS